MSGTQGYDPSSDAIAAFGADTQRLEASPDGAVSPAGARSSFQVLPSTERDPGFGVTPARDQSLAEARRVGQDYGAAMLRRYGGNIVLAHAAYNAGPGTVDGWLRTIGDPRTGAISDQDFVNAIPIKETRDYVGRLGAGLPPSVGPAMATEGTGGAVSVPPPSDSAAPTGAASPLGAAVAPAGTPVSTNPLTAFGMTLASGHRLVPVDYDPFKGTPPTQPQAPNLYSPVPQLGALPTVMERSHESKRKTS